MFTLGDVAECAEETNDLSLGVDRALYPGLNPTNPVVPGAVTHFVAAVLSLTLRHQLKKRQIVCAILFLHKAYQRLPQTLLDAVAGDRRPGRVQKGPMPARIRGEDDILDL